MSLAQLGVRNVTNQKLFNINHVFGVFVSISLEQFRAATSRAQTSGSIMIADLYNYEMTLQEEKNNQVRNQIFTKQSSQSSITELFSPKLHKTMKWLRQVLYVQMSKPHYQYFSQCFS